MSQNRPEYPQENSEQTKKSAGTVIFIRSDTIGRGDDELGSNLMMNHLHQLSKADDAPSVIIMMNAGVKLVIEGSEVLEDLEHLEKKGTTILVCGTCMNFYEVSEKQKAGKASNMAEITNALLAAQKVITV